VRNARRDANSSRAFLCSRNISGRCAGDGDGDIGNRPRGLLAQVFLHQTRQRIVGCELVAEGFSKHINEMRVSTVGLCQRVEQRANVIECPPGAERFGGAAANQGIGIV